MKIKSLLIMSTMVLVLLLGSCSLFMGTSIDERISQFQKDLNTSDRANIIDNFSENDCQDYNLINAADYWNTTSFFTPDKRTYSISVSEDDSTSASGKITFLNGSESIFFELVDEGSFFAGKDFKITNIWLNAKDDVGSDHQIKILSN